MKTVKPTRQCYSNGVNPYCCA